jgi:hypothetical protein
MGLDLECSNCGEAIEAGWNDEHVTPNQRQGQDLGNACCTSCWEDTHCRECGALSDDGEGYDGLCGNCADAVENAHPHAATWMG